MRASAFCAGEELIERRWEDLRSSAGWAVLQHSIHYRRTLFITRAGLWSFDLIAAAEFSLLPLDDSSHRTWYNGNLYSYESPPHLLALEEGEYELTVTYAHEVRIAGGGIPSGRWSLRVAEERERIEMGSVVVPSLVRGWVMGEAVGVEVRNIGVEEVRVQGVSSGDERVSSPAPLDAHTS